MKNKFVFEQHGDWAGQLTLMRGGGPEAQSAFVARLRSSLFYVPLAPDGKGVALLGANGKDKLFIPAFTAMDEFKAWMGRGESAAVRDFDALNGLVIDDSKISGIVINPFNEQYQLVLTRENLKEIENTATGMTAERVDHTGKTVIEAAEYTKALARSFAEALQTSDMEVFEAFILTARQEHEKKPHLMFLIDFNGDRRRLFPMIARAIQPHMKQGTQFELMKATFGLLAQARSKAAAVYKKKQINTSHT